MHGSRVGVGIVGLVVLLSALASSAPQDVSGDTTVYVTKTGTKYHRATCSSLSKSKIPMALRDAAKSYQPCKRCGPPVLPSTAAVPPAQTRTLTAASAGSPDGRCQAITKKGTRCKRAARPGSRYCWQHGG
jgi:hypothetical protein